MSLKLSAVAKTLGAVFTSKRLVSAVQSKRLLANVIKGLFLKILELADSFGVFDTLTRAFFRNSNESVSALDEVAREVTKPLSDAGVATDQLSNDVGKATDEIVLGYAAEDYFAQDYNTGDASILASDNLETIEVGKNPSDTALTSEQQQFVLTKQLTDTVFVTDDIDGEASILDDQEMHFFKIRSDLGFASDALANSLSKPLADAGSASDTQSSNVGKSIADIAVTSEDQEFAIGKFLADTPLASDALAVASTKLLTDSGIGSDQEVKLAGKVISDSASSGDSGSLISQNYTVDNTYFAEDYVGDSRTFT